MSLARRLHGEDRREYQAQSLTDTITDPSQRAWVAEREAEICGFVVAAVVDPERCPGEITMLAVDAAQ
jgi:hypothetical protein